MKKPIMIHVLALFLISTLASCASCSSDLKENGKENGKEEKPDTEEVRPESFASDDEMLDYIQKVHLMPVSITIFICHTSQIVI